MMDTWKELYRPGNKKQWKGRIDSHEEVDAFRWHQCIAEIDLNLTDNASLDKSKTSFCFLGFVCDEGVHRNLGRSGAAKGSQYLRREMSNLAWDNEKNFSLFDAGNVFCKNHQLEIAQEVLAKAIDKMLQLGLIPILLGGGHDIAFGHFNGILSYLDKKPEISLGIINFDAHFDLRPIKDGKGSSGTMFGQIADNCKKDKTNFNYLCLGIQTYANTKSLFKKAKDLGVTYELAKDINYPNIDKIKQNISGFIDKHQNIYLTICADVFSAAYAPGVSAPQPFGLQPDIGLELIKHVVSSGKVISFDLAEIAPRFDEDSRTAKLGAVLIYAMVNTISGLKIETS